MPLGPKMDPQFQRHVDACNNARLPGDRIPFRIGAMQVGWVKPHIAAALGEYDAISRCARCAFA